MEVVATIVGSALTEPFRFAFGLIYARIKNLFKIRSNYKDLERDISFVSALKRRLTESVDDETLQHCLPRTQVRDWLKRVEELESSFISVQSTFTANGCASSWHCKLSNDIVKQVVKAKQLVEEGRGLENMMIVDVNSAPKPVEHITTPSIEGQPTALRNLGKMMDLLRNDKHKRIGVWGMGGVGKTTLIKNLNNEIRKYPTDQLFSIVIWVVVSQQRSLKMIQSQIAERLKLQITMEESEHGVASRLYNRLEKERSFLLILDDVWNGIDLDAIGIPPLEDHSGSKIILTTRDFNVCRQMSTDAEFKIGSLSSEEAWKMFSQKVGEEVVNDDQVKPLAKAIVKECDGLPLAIITVGASMRKKRNVALWKDALDALQRSMPRIQGVEEKVFKPLKWSYNSLEGESLKSCFLFFCLFPEDFEVDIHRLVQYWLAEGLLDQQLNYEQLHDRCITIVESLKDSCLLEGGRRNTVKMHDVVRDVGIWIATTSLEDRCKSIVHAGIGETRVSQKQLLNCSKRVKRVSFMSNSITSLPDCKVQCLETSTLFLQGNNNLQEVPNSFLQGFQMLRILDLSASRIKFLPHSLLQLSELRALCLKGCNELSELPPLSALEMLQVLDCSGTAITRLPEDFEKLTNLRQLDLSYTHKLQKIPRDKIFSLCSLEFLNTMGSATKWGMREINEENVPFEELVQLDQLTAFYIDLEHIPHVTAKHISWLRRINNFVVNVSPNRECEGLKSCLHNRKDVSFCDFRFTGEESVGWLLVNAFSCEIADCKGVDLILGNLARNSVSLGPFANLKDLSIWRCYISFKSSSFVKFDLLPNLEKLFLFGLTELESLSDFTNFLGLRFAKLKDIQVSYCYQLENLLTLDGALEKLEKVEKIQIERCEKLTEVFKNASLHNFVPNLQFLYLGGLPALERICIPDDVSWQSLEHLVVIQCNVLQKLPHCIQNGETIIQWIVGEQHWWNKLQWDDENFKMRLQLHFKPCDELGYIIHQPTS